MGAALYQEQGDKLRVIAYASRGLSKNEKNYPTHKLKYLALKWAVCEKFSNYHYGTEFTVLTDNNPLTYVLTKAKLNAAGHSWLAQLYTYRFNIKFRAGSANRDADGLSRRPQSPPEVISTKTLSALSDRHSVVLSSEVFDTLEVILVGVLGFKCFICP